jgi:ABC-type nitrate/sulfonate/bicarbonate transport system permease component
LNQYGFIDKVISFLQNDPIIALIVAIMFLFVIYRKPKLTLFILILIFICAGIYYVIMDVVSSAKIEKKRLLHESEKSSTINGE